ncbi:MAG: hypothetical protein M1816_002889 [Peltula sp. TS41687]|nr:MAG: hypothetical protein M1816_002889 [Peltula sp. TS41687]
MSTSSKPATSVIPAQVAFIAIYNPSLAAPNEESLDDQIVYYFHRKRFRRKRRKDLDLEHVQDHEEKNERLRQVGLAQGMVQFAKNFANGNSVDSIETEKSRILLHELESEWWILASIDLTRLPLASNSDGGSDQPAESESRQKYEYSAREVSPSALLLQQLLRAHSIFLLHHGRCLDEIYIRLGRPMFCRVLDRFWTQFARSWDVLLHGNPSVEIYRGIKLAAGGELGMGVGEEEWGSGEREVLEGFVHRTDGLVDLLVSRFGDAKADEDGKSGQGTTKDTKSLKPHHRSAEQTSEPEISPSDGVIFSGTGAITCESARAIAGWMEWLHVFGEDAYGVRENPNSTSRRRGRHSPTRKRDDPMRSRTKNEHPEDVSTVRASPAVKAHVVGHKIEPDGPQVNTALTSTTFTSVNVPIQPSAHSDVNHSGDAKQSLLDEVSSTTGTATFMKYLTLGYGSNWGTSLKWKSGKETEVHPGHKKHLEDNPQSSHHEKPGHGGNLTLTELTTKGRFVIGLQGPLESEAGDEDNPHQVKDEPDDESEDEERHGRIYLRTININLTKDDPPEMNGDEKLRGAVSDERNSSPNSLTGFNIETVGCSPQKLRVIVYKNAPFIFTFLFELQTPALAFPAFYRSLHQQLGPLHRPLLASTSPEKVTERMMNSDSLYAKTAKASEPVYDLIYDPRTLTIHASIPNIPDPSAGTADASSTHVQQSWTRIEALNVHTQILNIFASTRDRWAELEHTCKTSRGWWVVWMRLPDLGQVENKSRTSSDRDMDQLKQQRQHREAFLIRKSSDQRLWQKKSVNSSSSLGGLGWTPGKLAEGIGIDTKRYIEGLWSLNR